ncbi:alpha/beta hydrolase [Amycolatopsis suaedae]|uniref:Alpha/beta hydrolase n=1 Tax=Amycolatopsis suaedae TaxID=2510978 RepID=A0A4Q7JAD8_9PSEU|nr:alpha/beta hydrolase [Amycolatopsis suaedae]RZQ63154.1 alpha/beta hydrolase [Amycolatopsis suaedae]
MRPGFPVRRALTLALAANALRPMRARSTAIPAFFAGWLTAELAPQLLAVTAADVAAHTARHGLRRPSDRVGLALAGLSAAGLGALITGARRADREMTDALTEALGQDYADRLEPAEPSAFLRQLAWPFRMSDPRVRRDRDIAYAPGGRRFLLDVYRPVEPVSGAPVLLQIHGGAWVIGNKDQQGIPLMLHMARRGWVCVAVNYPLSPASAWPEHVVGVKRAMAWVRENIADYGGDPSFVAATGGSAGGHLAALLALTAGDDRFQPGFTGADTSVQACVPHYGVYDFAATSGSRASAARLRLLSRRVVGKDPVRFLDDYVASSPLDRITDAAPPFLVIHGAHDTIVPVREARLFTERLREVSANPVAYAEISGAQHAFDVFPSIRSAHVVRGVRQFLEWTYLNREVTRESAPPRR